MYFLSVLRGFDARKYALNLYSIQGNSSLTSSSYYIRRIHDVLRASIHTYLTFALAKAQVHTNSVSASQNEIARISLHSHIYINSPQYSMYYILCMHSRRPKVRRWLESMSIYSSQNTDSCTSFCTRFNGEAGCRVENSLSKPHLS